MPKIADASALVVLAHQERAARYRLNHVTTRATKAGRWLDAQRPKSVVPAGDEADAFIVPARSAGADTDATGIALFIVEGRARPARRGYPTQDGARAAEITLANTPATLIALDALPLLEQAVDAGIAAICAEAVGVMDKPAITAEYMNTRKQFGVPIASFQALRHRIADVKMQLELARSMSYYASPKLGEAAPVRRRAIAQAKYQLGQSMRFVGQQCIQLHGGIGVTDEYAGSHYFKRLTVLEMTSAIRCTSSARSRHACRTTAGVLEKAVLMPQPATMPAWTDSIVGSNRPRRRPFQRHRAAHRLHGGADAAGRNYCGVDVTRRRARHARDRTALAAQRRRPRSACRAARRRQRLRARCGGRRDALAGRTRRGRVGRPGARAHRAGSHPLRSGIGDARIRPMPRSATPPAPPPVATAGAGQRGRRREASVGKLYGMARAMKRRHRLGFGARAGITVGALVAVNALGDVIDPSSGRPVAGAHGSDGTALLGTMPPIPRRRVARALPARRRDDDRRGRHRCQAHQGAGQQARADGARRPGARHQPGAHHGRRRHAVRARHRRSRSAAPTSR